MTRPTENRPRDEFERERPRLLLLANRILRNRADAEDAVQDVWIRLRSHDAEIRNLPAWLTTALTRICLDQLRKREVRNIYSRQTEVPPDDQTAELSERALLVEDALLTVMTSLQPAERLALVLHDVFDLPFADIARLVDRTPAATRQLASRGRRSVMRGESDRVVQEVERALIVDAYLRASQTGDIASLLAVLAPDVELSTFGPDGALTDLASGAPEVTKRAVGFKARALRTRLAFIDGEVGLVGDANGDVRGRLRFSIAAGRIRRIELILSPVQLADMQIVPLLDEREPLSQAAAK